MTLNRQSFASHVWNRSRISTGVLTLIIAMAGPSFAQVPCLSGFITDGAGNPVVNADLDLFDPVTGVKLVTPNDNSDAFGFYNLCVLPGVYDVAFAPPAGTHLLGTRFNGVNLTTALELNVVLGSGVVIRGRITDSLGLPVGDVDLDADRLTGGRAYTPDDNSDPITGDYWIVVSPDEYRIRFEPPPGSRLTGLQLDSVSVLSDITLNITLLPGVLLTGRITGLAGVGLLDIDVDLRDAVSGEKLFVANNSTNATGNYNVAVVPAIYDLRFAPPRGSRYLGVLIDSLQISGDRVWDQTLSEGLLVTVVVVDSSGSSVPGADLDFKSLTTGKKLFTPNDNTDLTGTAKLAVPPDLYKIQIDPPLSSLLGPLVLDSVSISSDTMLTITIPNVQRVLFSGRVTDASGLGIDGAEIRLRHPVTGRSVLLSGNDTDAQGFFQTAVPMGLFEVLVAPPASTRFVGMRISNVQFSSDSLSPDIVLNEGLLITFSVRDDLRVPATGTDIDFVSELTGIEVYTPSDNVDSLGMVTIPVLADVYTLRFDPPAFLSMLPLTISGVALSVDTTLSVTLRPASGRPDGPFVLSQNYPNPFNGETNIPFIVLQPGDIRIDIFNLLGQHVKRLKSKTYDVGSYVATWDGTNAQNSIVTSGMYLYSIRSQSETRTRKLILLR